MSTKLNLDELIQNKQPIYVRNNTGGDIFITVTHRSSEDPMGPPQTFTFVIPPLDNNIIPVFPLSRTIPTRVIESSFDIRSLIAGRKLVLVDPKQAERELQEIHPEFKDRLKMLEEYRKNRCADLLEGAQKPTAHVTGAMRIRCWRNSYCFMDGNFETPLLMVELYALPFKSFDLLCELFTKGRVRVHNGKRWIRPKKYVVALGLLVSTTPCKGGSEIVFTVGGLRFCEEFLFGKEGESYKETVEGVSKIRKRYEEDEEYRIEADKWEGGFAARMKRF